MKKRIKIVLSPFNPPLELVEGFVIKVDIPYSDSKVTIQVCPNFQEYEENADVDSAKIRQKIMAIPTDETTRLFFDLGKNRKQKIVAEGMAYEIELLNIGYEDIEGKKFRSFDFSVCPC
ncbi:MAG: hypothetical protein QG599_1218 [Pseudomonadota bacterium]|nr:hypothetical protein [Pseudomonadota bacterium]